MVFPMTRRIRLSLGSEAATTSVSNIFIDNYMADAHGSYVKVYIYLLRCLGDPDMTLSVASIADSLDETEKDIVKALTYWAKKNLLNVSYDEDGQICGISINDLNKLPSCTMPSAGNIINLSVQSAALNGSTVRSSLNDSVVPSTASAVSSAYNAGNSAETTEDQVCFNASKADDPVKPEYSPSQLSGFNECAGYNDMIDHIEALLARTLSNKDLQTPAFMFEILGFPTELIIFLYDYCVSNGKKSNAYFEKVAREWSAAGIDTIDKARLEILSHSKDCSVVRSAFGINRSLGSAELDYISRWTSRYSMSHELIREACNRTILRTGKPDFNYAESILRNWHSGGISTLADVEKLDDEYKSSMQTDKLTSVKAPARQNTSNRFGSFTRREHTTDDFAELEKKKLNIQ